MANNCKECNCNCHCSTKEHPNKTGVCSCTDCKREQREVARNVILDKYGVPNDKPKGLVIDDTNECEWCQ